MTDETAIEIDVVNDRHTRIVIHEQVNLQVDSTIEIMDTHGDHQ